MNNFKTKKHLQIEAYNKQEKMSFKIPIALFRTLLKLVDLFKKPLEKEFQKEGVNLCLEGLSEKKIESYLTDFPNIDIKSNSGEHRFKVSLDG